MAMYKIIFNGVNFWEELGATLKSAPAFPIPAEIKEQFQIKGANGTLTKSTGYFSDITIKMDFRAFMGVSVAKFNNFWELKAKINKTFNNILDDRLQIDGAPHYYQVKSAKVGAVSKISEHEADFTIEFICDPFQRSLEDRPINSTGTIRYNGDIPNAPIIKFRVTGNAEYVVTCNGKRLSFTGKQGRDVEINANPYSLVVLSGEPVQSTGEPPIFSNGNNTIEISGGSYNSVQIIKNERYLG